MSIRRSRSRPSYLQQQHPHRRCAGMILLNVHAATSNSDEEDNEAEATASRNSVPPSPSYTSSNKSEGEDDNRAPTSTTASSSTTPNSNSNSPPPTPKAKPLDPLFVAVTRMDEVTVSAKTVSVPLWGELILDRSLFVLLPLVAFAVGGILLSLYVLLNSGDAMIDAVKDNAVWQSTTTDMSTSGGITGDSSINSNACRGLCRSQEQDLEGLKAYMSKLARSKE